MSRHNPTQRFSSRVSDYIKYRPGYPPQVLATLREECGLTPASLVADIGSGTGILAEIFLKNGNTVYGIEPNKEMREAGEGLLGQYANFHSVAGTAEATTLPDSSVDFVTAGQAFHWFDHKKARTEFARILKPGGWVALVWNMRQVDTTPFLRDYEAMLNSFGTDYNETRHRNVEELDIEEFFAGTYHVAAFPNQQVFDYAALEGRLRSSSYTPEPGNPDFEPMLAALHDIFNRHQQNGAVAFEYDTKLFYGRLTPVL